jgi:iron(III) transport system permease protein
MALALMETLSDYGVGSYFGLTTFSTGIYRAWLSMGDRNAAAQLATMLLFLVAILVSVEHSAQHRLRFATARTGSTTAREGRLLPLGKLGRCVAWLVCGLPVLLGFFAPVAAMLRLVFQLVGQNPASDDASTNASALQIPWGRLFDWCFNSFYLASITAAIATAIAMALVFAQRRHASPALRWMTRTIALGYAVPGAVITVGILLPTGGLQKLWPDSPIAALLTSTVLGLIYAYLVRFCAVALQSIESGYARLPMSLDESARLLSQSGWRLWSRIHWPLMQRATWTALLLVFVDVMKELPATLMLRPFNRDTLAVVANQLARDERLAEAALPSLAIVAVGLIPVLLISRATRSKSPRKNREKSDVSIMETP